MPHLAAALAISPCAFPPRVQNKNMRKTKKAKVYSYQINLVSEAEGGYTVLVPLLPGCVTYGETIEEAVENAKEAIALHLENLAAHRQPIPKGQESIPMFTTLVHVTPSNI
jgi:predicted RNase H-like HicB family nuclease